MKHLAQALTLPNGSTLSNRLAKSATSEVLGTKDHAPSQILINAYRRWAQGGAGLLITGNVMVDRLAIGEPGNVVVEDEKDLDLLRTWAEVVKGTDCSIWAQINHPGRQALGFINRKMVAPSAIPLQVGLFSALFGKPKALEEHEILDLIKRYGNTAAILKKAGFSGVQIHGAHGYLVSQFLSPIANRRTDRWGGSLENRARFVLEVYREMRKQVGSNYPVGIKINSADFQRGGFTEEESIEVVRLLSQEGIDLIEISGGTYERPEMMVYSKASTQKREAYFLDYTRKARAVTSTPLMVTGGFRTARFMEEVVANGELDIVGAARPFLLYPDFAKQVLSREVESFSTETPKTGIKQFDQKGMLELGWYEHQIKLIGQGKSPNQQLSNYRATLAVGRTMIQKMFRKNK